MRSILALCVALFVSAIISADATTPSCAAMNPPPVQSACCSPIQIMFMMDNSLSLDPNDIKKAYNFAKMFRCSFPASANNIQLGMVSYNSEVKLVAPLKKYTEQEWYAEVNKSYTLGNIPTSAYTPMAEAFNLTREVFTRAIATTINPNCTAEAVQVQRVVLVFTDGNPAQNVNTPTVTGFPAFPTAWRVAQQDAGVYAETSVPGQAKLLKALGVRIIFLSLKVSGNNAAHSEYFAGLVESRKCENVRIAKGFGANFCANKLGNPSNLAVQAANSQCYIMRVMSGTNIGNFMDQNLASGWVCKYRNPNSNDFPIASTTSDVYEFTDSTDLANELLTKVVPAICPNDCFLL